MTKKVFVCMVLWSVGTAFADGRADRAAAASSTALVPSAVITANTPATCTPWVNILNTSVEASTDNDLFIGFSSQTGLFTGSANVNGIAGGSTFTAENVGIMVRVLVDSSSTLPVPPAGTLAVPGVLAWDNLIRETLQSNLSGIDFLTLAALSGGGRSFNFIKGQVAKGSHTVYIQSQFCYSSAALASVGSAAVSLLQAVIGPRTLTVEVEKVDKE